jgi:hypothetical protein
MRQQRNALRRVVMGLMALCTMLGAGGCSMFLNELSGEQEVQARKSKIQELQLQTMRLADDYVGTILDGAKRVEDKSSSTRGLVELEGWKLRQANAAYTVATGPLPLANLLDLVVLTSLSRHYAERWTADTFGGNPEPLVNAHRQMEEAAMKFLSQQVDEKSVETVRKVVDIWYQRHPDATEVGFVRFVEFAKESGVPMDNARGVPSNLFRMLGLDPLEGIDPAVRQIEQSRLLAERAIYFTKRLPYLLDIQFRYSALRLAAMPEVRSVLTDADRATAAADRVADTVAALPQVIARERAALIEGTFKGFEANEARARGLVAELNTALGTSDQAAASIRDAVKALDALVARFDQPAGAAPGKPFDIAEYGKAATDIAQAAAQLQRLLERLDQRVPAAQASLAPVVAEARSLADLLFWRLVALTVLLPLMCAAAALLYVRLAPKLRPPARV